MLLRIPLLIPSLFWFYFRFCELLMFSLRCDCYSSECYYSCVYVAMLPSSFLQTSRMSLVHTSLMRLRVCWQSLSSLPRASGMSKDAAPSQARASLKASVGWLRTLSRHTASEPRRRSVALIHLCTPPHTCFPLSATNSTPPIRLHYVQTRAFILCVKVFHLLLYTIITYLFCFLCVFPSLRLSVMTLQTTLSPSSTNPLHFPHHYFAHILRFLLL